MSRSGRGSYDLTLGSCSCRAPLRRRPSIPTI